MTTLAITGTYLEQNVRFRLELPGGGPWRILPECPAILHNTLRAAERGSRYSEKCICPHGRALIDAENARRRASAPRRKRPEGAPARKPKPASERTPVYYGNARSVERPALRHGLCMDDVGREIIENALPMSGRDSSHALRLAVAKTMCGRCIEQPECAEWILKAEYPQGSWGGFYAGMTPREREREGKRG